MTRTTLNTKDGKQLAEQVRIHRKNAPDVRFFGHLLHEERSGSGERWTQLELWALPSGAWVAATMGMSDKAGEVDIGDAVLIQPGSPEEMAKAAMAFWGWTWLCKRVADRMGWSYVEEWK